MFLQTTDMLDLRVHPLMLCCDNTVLVVTWQSCFDLEFLFLITTIWSILDISNMFGNVPNYPGLQM